MSKEFPNVMFSFSPHGEFSLSHESDVEMDVLTDLLAMIAKEILTKPVDTKLIEVVRHMIEISMKNQINSGGLIYDVACNKWVRPRRSLPHPGVFISETKPPATAFFGTPYPGELSSPFGAPFLPDLPIFPADSPSFPSMPDLPPHREGEIASVPIISSPFLKKDEILVLPPGSRADMEAEMTIVRSKGDDLEKLAEIIGYKEAHDASDDEEDDELDLECGLFDEIDLPEEPDEEPDETHLKEIAEEASKDERIPYCILTDIETSTSAMFQHFDFQRLRRADSPHVEFEIILRVSDIDVHKMEGLFRPGNRFCFATSDDAVSFPLIVTDVKHQHNEFGRAVHLKGSVLDPEGPPETPSFWKGVL